jgi:hypothetical protein
MIDGRITVYFGREDRKTLGNIFESQVGPERRFRSEAEFLRHCISYTLEHDKDLKASK